MSPTTEHAVYMRPSLPAGAPTAKQIDPTEFKDWLPGLRALIDDALLPQLEAMMNGIIPPANKSRKRPRISVEQEEETEEPVERVQRLKQTATSATVPTLQYQT